MDFIPFSKAVLRGICKYFWAAALQVTEFFGNKQGINRAVHLLKDYCLKAIRYK